MDEDLRVGTNSPCQSLRDKSLAKLAFSGLFSPTTKLPPMRRGHETAVLTAVLMDVRFYAAKCHQAVRTAVSRNFTAERTVSTMKSASRASCAILKGGSDCVGAIAFRAGTFSKSCTAKTKTFR